MGSSHKDGYRHIGALAPDAIWNALKRASLADQRTLSSLMLKILADWLQANGWLKKGK